MRRRELFKLLTQVLGSELTIRRFGEAPCEVCDHYRPPLQAELQAELLDIERAVATPTREAGRGLKSMLRRQVTGSACGSWRQIETVNIPLAPRDQISEVP